MSFSRRRVVDVASKGAEHVLGRFILAVCFFHHPTQYSTVSYKYEKMSHF